MGCDVRDAADKAERFPGCTAHVSWPYTCVEYPTLQLLAKRLQDNTADPKSATIVGGKIMSKTTCVSIALNVCAPP